MSDQKEINERRVLIPGQYVGKPWRNESGISLKIFQVVDLEDYSLIKIFVPMEIFNALHLAKILKSGGIIATFHFEIDDEGRENLMQIDNATERFKIQFDK